MSAQSRNEFGGSPNGRINLALRCTGSESNIASCPQSFISPPLPPCMLLGTNDASVTCTPPGKSLGSILIHSLPAFAPDRVGRSLEPTI